MSDYRTCWHCKRETRAAQDPCTYCGLWKSKQGQYKRVGNHFGLTFNETIIFGVIITLGIIVLQLS